MLSIILAAGNGQRFADAGYRVAKPLLPMPDGRPVLAWVRERLPAGMQLLIAREADRAALIPWIDSMPAVWLPIQTDGPLASLREARIAHDGPILVSYCDTLLPDGAQPFVDAARAHRAVTAMVLFLSDDPRYGYWTGERVVEKQVASPWAVSGLFYFQSGAALRARMERAHAVGAGLPSLLDAASYGYHADVIDVGTPADYEQLINVRRAR